MVIVDLPSPPVRTPIGARLEARGVRPRVISAKRSWPPGCPSAPETAVPDRRPPTPIRARLAARGVRPRKVSAKRSWPPGCGAPEAGDGEKDAAAGVIKGSVEAAAGHAVVSPAACNGELPPVTPQKTEHGEADIATMTVIAAACNRSSLPQALPVPEKEEEMKGGREEELPDLGDIRLSNSLEESMATEVMPPALAAPRLAARGVRPREVSCKRSWPPGCGRFPLAHEAGDGEKDAAPAGVIEGRVEEAAGHAVEAASNGDLPPAPPKAETNGMVEEKEPGGATTAVFSQALPVADTEADVRSYNGPAESMRTEAMPPALAAPPSLVVAASANGFVEIGALASPMESSGQLVRESRVDDDGHDAVRKKKLPPKRRAVSAVRKFPPGCGSS